MREEGVFFKKRAGDSRFVCQRMRAEAVSRQGNG
jgi:hypothetical protein